jgi:16S rRNA (uracil1498-N3)-methyltransferase
MGLPFFYIEDTRAENDTLTLNEETSKHVIQVLRMGIGESLQLTDGKGNLLLAEIINDNRKKAAVKIIQSTLVAQPERKIRLAVSLIKNNSRFEWLLEKATELGIGEIIPLICERTEKQHFRFERMKGILISAMLQSQQVWLPVLHEPVKLKTGIASAKQHQKFIGHCEEGKPLKELTDFKPFTDAIILIGPEGDFSSAEIKDAITNNFIPVSLGNTRLRTETAAIAAAVILQVG